jgi:hypothetical protein
MKVVFASYQSCFVAQKICYFSYLLIVVVKLLAVIAKLPSTLVNSLTIDVKLHNYL